MLDHYDEFEYKDLEELDNEPHGDAMQKRIQDELDSIRALHGDPKSGTLMCENLNISLMRVSR